MKRGKEEIEYNDNTKPIKLRRLNVETITIDKDTDISSIIEKIKLNPEQPLKIERDKNLSAEIFTKNISYILRYTDLTSLDISNNDIGDKYIINIAHALSTNKTLLELTLVNNYIENKGAGTLASILTLNKSPLTYLNLSCNGIGEEDYGSIALKNLATFAKQSTSLTHFDISDNLIKSNIEDLMDVFKSKSLKSLNLSNNELTEEEIDIIADSLLENDTLIEVNLGRNCYAGVTALGYIVNSITSNGNSAITELNLEYFGINSEEDKKVNESAETLAELIMKSKITYLSLEGNAISPEGCKIIQDAGHNKIPECICNLENQDHSDVELSGGNVSEVVDYSGFN